MTVEDNKAKLHSIENEGGHLTQQDQEELKTRVVGALKEVFDPEIPVDIYELGLIYSVDVSTNGFVHVEMTLTSPGCPVAGSLPGEVETKVLGVNGVSGASVDLVWDPPWSKDMMSEAAQLELGFL